MIVQFEKDYLKELFEKGRCADKKYRLPSRIVKKYCLRVETLQSAPGIEALYPLKSLNVEGLSGDKKGVYSIRIDLKYRLEFSVHKAEDTILTVCNLLKISNHYE